jgi:DNA-binding transcriptional MocR family regulator
MKIYEQICQDIKDDIINQNIKQGERLPSLLSMSKKYKCSKGSVIKAFEQLRSQHIIYSKPQSGYYVADHLIREEGNRKGFFLNCANPIVGSFPTFDAHHCLHIAAEMYSTYSLDIGFRGIPSLNAILPKYLAAEDVHSNSDNIYLIQGVTQILTHLTLTPFPNGKETILIESPTSKHYISFLRKINAKVLTIKRDEHGIDLKELERHFKEDDIKFFYVIPRNHNPLGTKLSNHQRKHIIELARKHNVYIVEDDYFGNAHKLPKYAPIHFFSHQQNCIHLRSMSKILPLLRIGVAIVPQDLHSMFETIMLDSYFYSYFMPNLISQATYEVYLESSIYEKHYAQITSSINNKLKAVRQITNRWNPKIVTLIGAESGYYFTLRLHPSIDIETLLAELGKKHVFLISNIDSFYNPEHFDNSVRLTISRITLEHLKEAMKIIYETIQSLYYE